MKAGADPSGCGEPLEIPAHPLLVLRQLAVWRTGHRDHRHVALLQVHADAVEAVGSQRAVRASRVGTGFKHEVIDDQLALSVKKLRQRLFPLWSLEHVFFPYRLPRQVPSLLVELVLQSRELLLLRQERLARRKPLLVRNHCMILDNAAAVVFHVPPYSEPLTPPLPLSS